MIDISKHITFAEATHTSVNLPNIPDKATIRNMQHIAQTVFEPLRYHLGDKPIKITSFFRSVAVNKSIGGAATSQHVTGQAMDLKGIHCTNADIFNYIAENLPFDQLIWEHGTNAEPAWVHVSLKLSGNRYQKLKAIKVNGRTKYEKM